LFVDSLLTKQICLYFISPATAFRGNFFFIAFC
jgi:hypothetical protein